MRLSLRCSCCPVTKNRDQRRLFTRSVDGECSLLESGTRCHGYGKAAHGNRPTCRPVRRVPFICVNRRTSYHAHAGFHCRPGCRHAASGQRDTPARSRVIKGADRLSAEHTGGSSTNMACNSYLIASWNRSTNPSHHYFLSSVCTHENVANLRFSARRFCGGVRTLTFRRFEVRLLRRNDAAAEVVDPKSS